jgi:hypothetical protein
MTTSTLRTSRRPGRTGWPSVHCCTTSSPTRSTTESFRAKRVAKTSIWPSRLPSKYRDGPGSWPGAQAAWRANSSLFERRPRRRPADKSTISSAATAAIHSQGQGKGVPAPGDRRHDQDGRQAGLEVRLYVRAGTLQGPEAVRPDPEVSRWPAISGCQSPGRRSINEPARTQDHVGMMSIFLLVLDSGDSSFSRSNRTSKPLETPKHAWTERSCIVSRSEWAERLY